MKKFLRILFVILLIGGFVSCGFMYISWQKDVKVANATIASQQATINAMGPLTKTYTVKAPVFVGKVISKDDLVEKTESANNITDITVVDISKIVGQRYKINIKPGTTITTDMIMQEDLTKAVYERDLVLQYIPVGLKVDDYVDIRIVLPYGEELIALNKKRAMMIVENVVKVQLSEEELAIYTSLRKDKALFDAKGLIIYASKYLEPGVAKPTVPFYPVRKEMESMVMNNANITDKQRCVNSALRADIDKKIAVVPDMDMGYLNAGANSESSAINNAQKLFLAEGEYTTGVGTGVTTGTSTTTDGSTSTNTETINLTPPTTPVTTPANTQGGTTQDPPATDVIN